VTILCCCAKLVFMHFNIGLWHRTRLLKLWVVAPNGVAKCNFGVAKPIGLTNHIITIFVKFARKLKGLQWIYFYCIFVFRGNIVLSMLSVVYYACLSYQMIIKPGTTSYELLHHDCFHVLTDTDLTTFIPTRRHASA